MIRQEVPEFLGGLLFQVYLQMIYEGKSFLAVASFSVSHFLYIAKKPAFSATKS